ncbi:MlaD family protein [Marinibacterium sp. SX1]|uniref:MlaD family protein n=1 Tax=Marinibacterium sp. SX1 TaxID=3388424 RepID=UPI003D181D99
MTDTPNSAPHPDDLPVEDGKPRRQVSLVWAVPVVALVIALGATWQNFSQRGPLIRVWFTDAAGIRADETELRFRDIPVGIVESVGFSDDLKKVVAEIRVHKDVAHRIDADARFWVVRPQVTAQGVRGLDTVLSGVYIQGAWDNHPGPHVDDFEGLDEEPLLKAGESGTMFTIYSDTTLPSSETPIFYKGIEVGRMDGGKISGDGMRVEAQAVILDPYQKLVTSSSRFWNVSGFSFTLNPGGASLDFTSIASLVAGGVTFDTLASGGEELRAGMDFELHPDAESAREDFYLDGQGNSVELMMIFDENPPGLAAGAAVEMGGLKIGEVQAISGMVDVERFGDPDVRLVATLKVNPGRLGLEDDGDVEPGQEDLLDYLDLRIAAGMRARLTNASILTGGLKIEMVDVPGESGGSVDRTAQPFPAVPTAPSNITDVTTTAQGLLQRASELPIEDLMASAVGFLNSARELVGSEELQAAPGELRAALAAIRDVATSDAIQGLPGQVTAVADDIRGVIGRVDTLLAQLDEEQATEKLVAAIESVTRTADSLPDLVGDARGLLEDARALPLQDLADRAGALLASAEAVLDQDSTRAIPAEVNAALEDLRDTLASVRAITAGEEVQRLSTELADASARLNAILTRIEDDDVVGSVTATLGSIDDAAASLPPLTEDARALIAQARALPLDELTTQVSDLLTAAQQIIDQGAARAIPSEITAALGEMRDTLVAVRGLAEGDDLQSIPTRVVELTAQLSQATERVNGFLATFDADGTADKITAAIDDLATAADSLPGLADQARALLDEARGLPLNDLAARASELLDAAERILDQPSARDLPAELNGTLASLRITLDEFRAGGVVENTNATLASARQAAEAVARASETLPELSDRLGRLAAQASTTLAGYDRTSEFSRDMLVAIRQVSAAAESIYRLSRQLERNPNSLIFGR